MIDVIVFIEALFLFIFPIYHTALGQFYYHALLSTVRHHHQHLPQTNNMSTIYRIFYKLAKTNNKVDNICLCYCFD